MQRHRYTRKLIGEQNPRMTDALIMLDLDGTLIDTSQLYFQGIPPIVQRHLGISVSDHEILPMWGQFARNFFAHFARATGKMDEALIDKMYEEFSIFYNEMHNRLSPAYESVCESLPVICEAVHAVGVVTTRPTSRSAPVLEMSWAKDVDFFVWGDQVPRNKPYPDGIEYAIQRYAVDDGVCVYVGDNHHDIKAAQACHRHVISVAALWGAMDRDRLLAAGPDLSFDTIQTFTEWVVSGCPAIG